LSIGTGKIVAISSLVEEQAVTEKVGEEKEERE
jgi:hypothetical protein